MKAKSILALLLLMLPVLSLFTNAKETPYPKREFRGAWIQCVNGQYLGKSMEEIRRMLSSQLDVLEGAGINAILFQVRAEGDALYASRFEPWSRYLTGVQGVAPQDGWDPLAWMVDECHKRNMECHAWINPYRAKTKGTTELAPNHIVKRHPDQVFQYGDLLIMNPALEANRMFTCMVVEDILERYDVDGIHMDDYFYPYPVAGEVIPDAEFFKADPRGFKNIGDWRRDNVNQLIKELYQLIREVKPWVKFGISPFGIYRNNPEKKNAERGSATNGTQNYDDLYADIVLWQKKGWIDYTIPQIYWNFGTKAADYEVLCHWWNDYCNNRPVYIGQDVERTIKGIDPNDSTKNQMYAKYTIQRSLNNIQGSCQWYAAMVEENPAGYRTALERVYHRYPALQPKMTFIKDKAPKRPGKIRVKIEGNITVLSWKPDRTKREVNRAVAYAIYDFPPGQIMDFEDPKYIKIITRNNSVAFKGDIFNHTIAVTALDHFHNESKPRIIIMN
jgi:uncharacterized lipoprotein YddW (UPF0748 family)